MYRALAFLGAALVVVGVLFSFGPEGMPTQVPSRSFLRGVVVAGVALVAIGLAGLAVG